MSEKNIKEIQACARKTSIGGQALLEGIMMRGPKKTAMAVRNPEGEIVLEKWDTKISKRSKFFKLPIIRGVFGFIDSMTMGYKCLMRSAEIAGLEEEEPKKPKKSKKGEEKAEAPAVSEVTEEIKETEAVEQEIKQEKEKTAEKAEEKKEEKSSSALMTGIMIVASVLGVVLAVFLFIMLPTLLFGWLSGLMPFLKPESTAAASLIKSVFEGILRIAVLIAYISLVSLMKDIRRTFQYHGAEHKTIFCYENGLELTVENVRKQRRFHPRCGTSFLILMLLVGMFISFFIDPLFILTLGYVPHALIRTLIKLLLLPITMGIGYELIKLAGRHQNWFTRIISAPGMWLQHLTVFEPTDDMIECAITAFVEVIPEDKSDNY